jgi:hypothetical protein
MTLTLKVSPGRQLERSGIGDDLASQYTNSVLCVPWNPQSLIGSSSKTTRQPLRAFQRYCRDYHRASEGSGTHCVQNARGEPANRHHDLSNRPATRKLLELVGRRPCKVRYEPCYGIALTRTGCDTRLATWYLITYPPDELGHRRIIGQSLNWFCPTACTSRTPLLPGR